MTEQAVIDVHPRLQRLFQLLGQAMVTHDPTAWVDAQNELQDILDERQDLARGPGGGDGR